MERPDLPAALELSASWGLPFDMMTTSFFMKWRERLFMALSRNAMNATNFFKIPTNRVIEMGTGVEI
jgi:KUP system potassium uptake protein